MLETFTNIVGYEGLYLISNFGRVKSLPKGDGNGNRSRFLKPEIVERPHTSYYRVTLSKDGKTNRFQIHRLVALHFLENPTNLPLINHLDNNGINNNISNLEWCTQKQNMKHSADQGRQDAARSAGGIATTTINTIKAEEYANSLIGSSYGNLTVLSTHLDTEFKKKQWKYVCKCNCGNTVVKNKSKLMSGVQACKECTYKARVKTRNKTKI